MAKSSTDDFMYCISDREYGVNSEDTKNTPGTMGL